MAEIQTLQSWKEERILREAASCYERRETESLQRLKTASKGLDGLKASLIWQAIEKALELAEMALERG